MTKVIMNRSVCSINFELFFADGTAVDSNKDLDPVIIEIGDGILLPKLEEALQGLAEGCTREVKLTPEHAYGFANPNEFFEFPVAQLPDEARQVGASVMAEDENGEQKVVLVSELKGDKAVLDFNHPYAGRTLIYKIELLAIAEA